MENYIPTIDQVRSYCSEKNLRVNPDRFYEYYSRSNFTYKGLPIDWKAQLSKWDATEYTRPRKIVTAEEYDKQPKKKTSISNLRKVLEKEGLL